jgi:outer membrane protein assembly factor BamB
MRTALLLVATLPAIATAQDWPTWRGPNHDGSSTATGLPKRFSKTDSVRWVAPMPGPGAGTPVIVGENVFVPSTDPEKEELVALRLDRESGEVLWRRTAGSGYRPGGDEGSKLWLHDRSNYASPSPVCDGERVIFFFGNGDLVCYDLAGAELWRKNIQKVYGDFAFQWTFSATPTLWEGQLVLPVLQRDEPVRGLGKDGAESFLLALDPVTGKERYRVERPSPARVESRESYATAIPYVGGEGRKELLVVGGDVLTGHDPATGRELWRWGTWNPGHREKWWRVVPSACIGGGVALVCGPKRAPVFAVKLGGEGELGPDSVAWQSEGRRDPVTSDVPTPLYYEGSFFVLSDMHGALSKLDPETGDVAWTTELPGRHLWRASPTGADGRVFLMNHGGTVLAIDAASGEVLHTAEMGEPDDDKIRASVAVAQGALFVRTNAALYCLAEDDDGE